MKVDDPKPYWEIIETAKIVNNVRLIKFFKLNVITNNQVVRVNPSKS